MNRLSRVADGRGAEAVYQYNGLGQRTGRTENGIEESYLLDLTCPYHNLLGIMGGGKEQTFYWDGNVVAMEALGEGINNEGGSASSELHYYLQDELGSPIRVSGYEGLVDYLTYGYDESGNDLYADLAGSDIPNPYAKQGEEQPFGFTGYRMDGISGTYFAQAREYLPENGRFTAEDVISGNRAVPVTLNRYGYCWENLLNFVDINGKTPVLSGFIMGALPYLARERDKIENLEEGEMDLYSDLKEAVLFQELRFYGIDDPIADSLVVQSYAYEIQMDMFMNGEPPFLPKAVLGYRTDSSTGIGQIFAGTAIEALNSYFDKTIYNADSWEDRREVWYALQDDYYSINMIALVLKYKEKNISKNPNENFARAIMAAYNGKGYWAEKYGDVTLQYYLAFKAYNSRENCGLE